MEPSRAATVTTIEELPDEVLELVVEYLCLKDRKRTRLVCKRWLDITDSAAFAKNDVNIVVKDHTNFSPLTTRPIKNHLNLRFLTTKSVSGLNEFMRNHGVFVRSIEIAPKETRDYSPLDMFNYIRLCPNIESLCLGFSCSQEKGEALDKNDGIFKRLTSLELDPDRIGPEDVLRFTKNGPNLLRFGLRSFENVENIERICIPLVERDAHSIEQIYLPDCQLRSQILQHQVIGMLGSQLKGLHIPFKQKKFFDFADGSYEILRKAAKQFPLLEELDLSSHFILGLLNSDVLNSAFSSLMKLKFLSLRGTAIGNCFLPTIAALQHLRGLDLSSCAYLTTDGVLDAFGQTKHSNLLKLRLNYNNWVTDDLLCLILPQFPNLRSLHFDKCSAVTSKGLSAVFTNCKMLTCLSLANCTNIKSLAVEANNNNLKGLKYLDLENCCNLKESLPTVKLPELQILNLSDVFRVEHSLLSILVNCPSLETVGLYVAEKSLISINLEDLGRATNRKCSMFKEDCLNKEISIFDAFNFCRERPLQPPVYCLKIEPIFVEEDVIEDKACFRSCALF